MNSNSYKWDNSRDRSGIVLLVTLVLMVVLATLGYTLSSRVANQRHRNQYIIDYSIARYGCDSAVKYALATLEEIDPQLISRPNEPDFSDLFYLTEEEYQELLAQWAEELQLAMPEKGDFDNFTGIGGADKVNDVNYNEDGVVDFAHLGFLTIPGPYGPPWPFITEPVEFDVGSAKVRIEIEDENAKYPLGWAMLDERAIEREVQAGFESFCEMAGLGSEQIDILKDELNEIGQIRPFEINFKTITRTVKTPMKAPVGRSGKVTRARKNTRTRTTRKTIPVSEQITEQTTHFAKIFHSSMLNAEALARPTIVRSDAIESPLKYMGLWGTMKVNINTAPRHVLEAAFIFGGDEVEIADEIIRQRRIKPFEDIEELQKELYRYANAIGRCEKYITTTSRFFTIKVTAVSGVAQASSIIAITKDGEKVKRIALING